MTKKKKNIGDLTSTEVEAVIKLSGVCAPDNNKSKMISRKKDKITMWNTDYVLMLTTNGVHKVVGNIKDHNVENNFKIAQYLIDRGYRFDYEIKD